MSKKSEIYNLIISSLVLGFVFGFNDNREIFNLSSWLQNFFIHAFISFLFLYLFIKITQWYSVKIGITTNFKIWSIKRFGFTTSSYFKGSGIPTGIILPILISFLSFGKMFFSATLMPEHKHTKSSRMGKKFENPTDTELGLISLVGPLSLTIIAIFLSPISSSAYNISLIPFSIAFSTMIPISKLNGTTAFMYSPSIYIFSMILIISSYLLTKIISPLGSIILGIIISALISFTFYIKSYIFFK